MLKKKLLVAALASSFSLAALADEHTFTGNVGFTSDYVFRGISQNFRSPAIQGGFDYVHASGFYAGTWASNVSGNQYSNASMEWDWYAGYNGKATEDVAYNVGLVTVVYPGGKTSTVGATKKWDTTEFQFGGTFKDINVAYHYALTDWFGISDGAGGFSPTMTTTGAATADKVNASSKGSGYLEVNYTYALPSDVSLALHAGHQKIANFGKLSYSDFKIGVSKAYAGFNFGLAYTKTNATDNTLYHVIINGDDKKLGTSIFALSVSRSL